jgi:hypothetical protein
MGIGLTEIKINSLIKLFNQQTGNRLELILTANKEDNTIRGYGMNFKSCDEINHFVSLLVVKGIKAQYREPDGFIVTLE